MSLTAKLEALLERFLPQRQFTFRFDEYNGTEEGNSINDTNVVEYEFINSGSTVCLINAGLKLYPVQSGILPNRVKLSVNYNEMDITIYNYSFLPVDASVVEIPYKSFPGNANFFLPKMTNGQLNGTVSADFTKDFSEYNRLIVISKIKASLKGRSDKLPAQKK